MPVATTEETLSEDLDNSFVSINLSAMEYITVSISRPSKHPEITLRSALVVAYPMAHQRELSEQVPRSEDKAPLGAFSWA